MAEPATSERRRTAGHRTQERLQDRSARCGRSRASTSRSTGARSSACSATTASGKSTLVKVVMGFHKPDPGGEIYFHGERMDDWSVAKARSLGIETVYQERALCREAADLAQHVHGARAANASRPARRRADARRMRAADERAHGLHLGRRASRQCRRDDVGRREAGGRDHPRPLFRGRARHPRRADHGPVAQRDQEDARLRPQHQGRRQVGDLHRPQHLQRLSGRRPALRARSRQGRGRLQQKRNLHGLR